MGAREQLLSNRDCKEVYGIKEFILTFPPIINTSLGVRLEYSPAFGMGSSQVLPNVDRLGNQRLIQVRGQRKTMDPLKIVEAYSLGLHSNQPGR